MYRSSDVRRSTSLGLRSVLRLNVVLFPMERWGSIEAAVEAVRRADELGFSSVGLSEHIVNPIKSATGQRAVSSDLWFDNFVLGGLLRP
jgi:hypothetical protein